MSFAFKKTERSFPQFVFCNDLSVRLMMVIGGGCFLGAAKGRAIDSVNIDSAQMPRDLPSLLFAIFI